MSFNSHLRRPSALQAALLAIVASATCACTSTVPPPPMPLSDGAPSVEALLDRFTDALSRRDAEALHRLRLSKAEYVDIIIPGNVPKGQPPQQTFEQNNEFFWGMLDTKSRYLAPVLLRDFGGRTYVGRTDVRFTDPPREHDWYTARGELRMTLVDDAGGKHFVRSGWIAEVEGRYKFIGFEWDD
jgi:hypothetical protein